MTTIINQASKKNQEVLKNDGDCNVNSHYIDSFKHDVEWDEKEFSVINSSIEKRASEIDRVSKVESISSLYEELVLANTMNNEVLVKIIQDELINRDIDNFMMGLFPLAKKIAEKNKKRGFAGLINAILGGK